MIIEYLDYKHIEAFDKYIDDLRKDDPSINGVGFYSSYDNKKEWVKKEKDNHLGINVQKDMVPATLFVGLEEDEIIGSVNIRHDLNDYLFKYGGHIGYGVSPKHRRQGYATLLLVEALKFCKKWDIWPVLVTCNKTNIASKKTIEKCGGVLENEVFNAKTNQPVLRYWIGGKK